MNSNISDHPHNPCGHTGVGRRLHYAWIAIFALLLILVNMHVLADEQVVLCHLPPTNPDNPQTIEVDVNSVDDHLSHGDFLGQCPPSAAELDPPVISIDPTLIPPENQIVGIDGGPRRNLVRMNSDIGDGYQFDFVVNEVYLVTKDSADLADFQSRWISTVLFQIELPSTDPSIAPTSIYLLRVDPSKVNTSRLNDDLADIDPQLHGQHQVSSEAGLQLLALVAGEIKRHRLRVGLNVLLQSQQFADRDTQEAMIGDDQASNSLNFTYTRNGFKWPYMLHNPAFPDSDLWPLDTGVAEAFRVVEAEGRLSNRVRVLIADGGFFPNDDFPPYQVIGSLWTPNPDPDGCGTGHLPVPGEPCYPHGTHVVETGFGLPDNGFGTFGPGGPVSDLILMQSPSVDVESVLRYMTNAIPEAVSLRPQIINVSASIDIPAGWCFIACEPIDEVSNWLYDRQIIFVAAAGNYSRDVDAIDEVCVLGCISFEEAAVVPCETDHVVCVGADNFFQGVQTDYSNYGTAGDDNSVDIFAPGNVYSVNPLTATRLLDSPVDDLHIVRGTSFASPFTAGVIALTWAANPLLNNSQVLNCVLGSARNQQYPGVTPRINALGAVSCAMSGSAPFVKIASPVQDAEYTRGIETVSLRANADDYEDGTTLTINWSSSLDGNLGATASGEPLNLGALGLSLGEHVICASVTDSSLRNWEDCHDINVVSAAPIVEILQPAQYDGFYQPTTIMLSGTAVDPDGPVPTDVTWSIGPSYTDQSDVATGLNASISTDIVPAGDYIITLRARDETGAVGTSSVGIQIFDSPDNAHPVITISEPVSGSSVMSVDGGPVTLPLVAAAEDAEDGAIPFDQIHWSVLIDGVRWTDLPVNTITTCIIYDPILMRCDQYKITHSIELAPQGSNTSTRYDIKGRVTDSDGNYNESGNGRVTVFVTQFI